MPARILVLYTSRKGSTMEIAQAVARELERGGHAVDVVAMKAISTLGDYQAVVVGAPVYMGRIEKEVEKFVQQHHNWLSGKPVAAFAVGIAPVAPEIEPVEKVREDLQRALTPVKLVATAVFAGKLDPDKMSFIERKMTGLMKVKTGDFRDWNAIAAWAGGLPKKLGL